MLDTTSLAVSGLVAHAHINPEAQRELQLSLARVLNNAPAGITQPQKQLALIILLEELGKALPAEFQADNTLAVVGTFLIGARILIGVSSNSEPNA